MRVSYFINNLFPGDGVGNSIVELCRLLIGEGALLRVYHERKVRPPEDLRDLFTQASFDELPVPPAGSDLEADLEHYHKSDVVFFDYSVYYPLAQAITLPCRGKKVFIYHGVTPPHLWSSRRGQSDLVRGVDRLGLARHADYVVAASSFAARELTDRGVDPARVVVLPYCVRSHRFHPQPRDAALRDALGLAGHFVLLYTGRMARNKRIDTLVAGMAAARRRGGLPLKLLLVGDSESAPYLPEVRRAQAQAERLGVQDHVIFTGKVADEELPRYFQLADLYVSASLHEGFGIPLVEAMAAGKPVVAARAASVPSVVGDAGGYFEPGDAHGMAGAVVELLNSALSPPRPVGAPRLCFVVPRYGPGFAGGAEALCRGWAETCHRAGWPVQVVTTTTDCMRHWNNRFAAGADTLNGVPVRRFAVDRSRAELHFHLHDRVNADPGGVSPEEQRRWMETGLGSPELFGWLAEHRGEFDFFVFLPYLFNTTVLGVQAVGDKALVIPCLHDEGPARAWIVRRALEGARGVFFNTTAERDFALRALRLGNPNCFTVGMGMEPSPKGDETAFRRKYGITGDYFLYCGRLEGGKNVHVLLDHFRHFRASPGRDALLVCIGSGHVAAPDGVRVLGYVSEEDKRGALAGAVALINPSLRESFSIVLMESWLQGRPVVVPTACAVTAEHVRRSGGGLCYDDEEVFAGTLTELRTDRALADRLGALGRWYVREHYDWTDLLDRFRGRLDLLRSASMYEQLSLRAIARARYFDYPGYADRWRMFLATVLAPGPGRTPAIRSEGRGRRDTDALPV